jgi:hypothetical protein
VALVIPSDAPWIMIAFPVAGFVHTAVNSLALRETPLVLTTTPEKLKVELRLSPQMLKGRGERSATCRSPSGSPSL